MSQSPTTVAVIGLGEVGRTYATALAGAGHQVRGYDLQATGSLPGVDLRGSLAETVGSAAVVLTVTPAAASTAVATEVSAVIDPAAVYADFTSSAPGVKAALSKIFSDRPGVSAVDVAILGPVVQLGASTPLMAAGPGAAALAALMETVGAATHLVGERLGDAMGHKLLRSVFMKSAAAAVSEAVAAGRAAGYEDWVREQIARELSGGHQTVARFLRGSVLHAARRAEEMDAAAGYISDLGIVPTMAGAAAELHRRYRDTPPEHDIDAAG